MKRENQSVEQTASHDIHLDMYNYQFMLMVIVYDCFVSNSCRARIMTISYRDWYSK